MLSMQHFTNYSMDYKRYLRIQWRLEWFYDFHPESFDDIPPEQKKLLQDTFLYDAPDEGYPESLRDFYNKNIDNQPALQNDMLLAVDALYKAAGAGGWLIMMSRAFAREFHRRSGQVIKLSTFLDMIKVVV